MINQEQTTIESREIELRVYDINPATMHEKLSAVGAQHLGTVTLKRAVMDVSPKNENRWIRLRTDGDKTTLAVKERITNKADGTGEFEVNVSSYDETLKILHAIGNYTPRSIQETIREEFALNGSAVSIDTWPQLGAILEIEAATEEMIYESASTLGIDVNALTAQPVEAAYLERLGIDVKNTELKL